MKIHVYLVSEQILANLLPALLEKPDVIWLVVTAEMKNLGLDVRLTNLLKSHFKDNRLSIRTCPDVPDVGMPAILEKAYALADSISREHPNAEVTLYATGGTKLMAFGFIEGFRAITERIAYVDTKHRRVEYLPDRDGRQPGMTPIPDLLDIRSYLSAQGFAIKATVSDDTEWRARSDTRKSAAKYLAKNAEALGGFIGKLNALADQALVKQPGHRDEVLKFAAQDLGTPPRGIWVQALRELVGAGIIGWKEGETQIGFLDVEGAKFARGGWLEEYAWHVIRDEKIYDIKHSVVVKPADANSVENEFDVLAVNANQLLVVECKTLRFRDGENDNEVAYRIDSLGRHARGLFGETWLLSGREPTETLKDRARANRITLVGPAELKDLRKLVQVWKG